MTLASLLALAAGGLAAAGIADLAHWRAARRFRVARSAGRSQSRAGLTTDRRRSEARPSPARALPLPARFAVRAGRAVGTPPAPADLALRLEASGTRLSVADVMALKAGAALAALLAGAPTAAELPGRLAVLALPAAALGGYRLPDFWLARRTRRRRRALEAEAADVIDLVRVALEAGLPVVRALDEVGRRHAGPLATELRRVVAEVEVGASAAAALERFALRVPAPEAPALAAILRRASRDGVPTGPALAALAAEARANRTRASLEGAARAAPQIQLVVALLLVPAAMLLVAAALVPSLAG